MNHPKDHRFGAHCLADAWQLDQIHQQIQTSATWLQTYLQTYQSLLKQHPRNYPKLERLQLSILTEATLLQNLLNQHINLTQKNKDSFITSTAYIRQAENLLYVAQTTLIHPIKP